MKLWWSHWGDDWNDDGDDGNDDDDGDDGNDDDDGDDGNDDDDGDDDGAWSLIRHFQAVFRQILMQFPGNNEAMIRQPPGRFQANFQAVSGSIKAVSMQLSGTS